MMLTNWQWEYVRRTVEEDLRRKTVMLRKFAPKPGQESHLAEEARQRIAGKVALLKEFKDQLIDNKPKEASNGRHNTP